MPASGQSILGTHTGKPTIFTPFGMTRSNDTHIQHMTKNFLYVNELRSNGNLIFFINKSAYVMK